MKHIIITGASNGIGRAIAKRVRNKYQVINIDKEEKPLKKVLFYACDLSNINELKQTVEKIKQTKKGVFALVNNAGIFMQTPLQEQTLQEWNTIIATNLTAPFFLSQAFSQELINAKGHIINIASTRALMSEQGTEAYSASKGGLVALTHALALSFSHQVKVNAISPGWIHTQKKEKLSKKDNLQHPSGRVGTPKDIAKMVEFLLQNDGFITGSNFVIDGGMTKKMIYEE
jgi:NAD(P)-dependent dehydrogenase (short-subunit alcohol dehydrogenase family)